MARLVLAFLLGSVRTAEYSRPIFLAALAGQILLTLLTPLGTSVVTQWTLILASLVVMHEPEDNLLKIDTPPLRKLSAALQLPVPGVSAYVPVPEAPPSAASTNATASGSSTSGWLNSILGLGGMSGAEDDHRHRHRAGRLVRVGVLGPPPLAVEGHEEQA